MWIVWDRKSDVNGTSAERFLKNHKFLAKEETIFFKIVDGRVIWTEGKNALATVYNIDPELTNDEFIAAYEEKLAEMNDPDYKPDETATYAELAQVYKEGVNGLE